MDPYVDQMRVLLTEYPKMPATVLAERVGFNDGHDDRVLLAAFGGGDDPLTGVWGYFVGDERVADTF